LVEKAVSIAYSRIFAPLRDQVFFSLAALNQAIGDLLQIHNNTTFQQRPWSRQELFDKEEKHLLAPLAAHRFELSTLKKTTVMKNGFVQIFEDKHYYSVPYRFIGKEVKVIYSASHVSVFYNRERIAYHTRNLNQFSYTTTKDHLSSTHRFVSEWNPEFFTDWAGNIAPVVKEYISRLLDRSTYPETAYRSCVGILSQEKKVGKERLIKAIERATFYGIFTYSIITKILQAGLDQVAFTDEVSPQIPLPFHENIRGSQEYK